MPGQLRAIGVIAPDLGGYYFGAMITGIHQVARDAGMPLIVVQQALGDQQLPAFGSDHIAGWVILHPNESDRANLAALCTAAAPVVMVPVPIEGIDCTLVQVDNRGGMRAAVLHLIDHGHQRIAYVDHGPHPWSQQRYLGYHDALQERGIALDPTLVIRLNQPKVDGVDVHQERGEHAARYLLEQELACTALAASTDTCAIAAMRVLQAAGRRVPEDLAIVGYDDIVEAQYTNPPLTTVRSQFDAIGRAAAKQLLAELQDGPAEPRLVISVPTTTLQRRSCGCTALDERLSCDGATNDDLGSWQTTLTRQLVEVVRYPLPLDPAVLPQQLWPGAGVLVAALDAALCGQQPPSAGIELAWRQAIEQTESLEALHAALTMLEDRAEQRLAAISNAVPRQPVTALLRRMRLELMRARLAYEVAPKQLLGDQVRTNYAVSMALLGGAADARSLGWLEHTPAIWGSLGLWADGPDPSATTLTLAGAYQRAGSLGAALGRQLRRTAFPPLDQLPIEAQIGQELIILCPIRTPARAWGMLALCGWRDQALTTGTENLTIQAALLGATLDQNAVLSALTEQQATLNDAYQRERMLAQTVREIGCPIIPMLPGVLLVPLIGAIDSQRAQEIISGVLEAIGEQRAHTVFLDVTGVPIVDTQVASSLIQTAQAATLLGARVVMVGIRPEIAQSIVGLGIDLRHLTMSSTLASAISTLQLRRDGSGPQNQAPR
jgi:DNA-binding LacI/PurR family transcriptional regulator/anti-anti-sigma regulatory factor